MAHVLIIDDELPVRTVLRALLEREGHTVLEAPDGRAGLALLRTSSVDLVLTDIFMPEKDGIEVIMEIKRRWPHSKIIAITGGGQAGQTELIPAALLLGATRMLQKPIAKQALIDAVAEALADRAVGGA